MPPAKKPDALGRREQQIMDVVHRLGETSVGDIREALADPPSYSAVRTMVRHLESKGLLKHREDGRRYVYKATQSRKSASRRAIRKVLDVFFDGSPGDAVAALMDVSSKELGEEDLERIEAMIRKARRGKN